MIILREVKAWEFHKIEELWRWNKEIASLSTMAIWMKDFLNYKALFTNQYVSEFKLFKTKKEDIDWLIKKIQEQEGVVSHESKRT